MYRRQRLARLFPYVDGIAVTLYGFDQDDLAIVRAYGARYQPATKCWVLTEPAARALAQELEEIGFTVRARWPRSQWGA